MHVVQLMLVKAAADESLEDVQSGVESTLEELIGKDAWFDWFGEGAFGSGLAGRWAGEVEADVLRYSDDPEKAERMITEFMGYRLAHLEHAQKQIEDFDIRTAEYSENYDLQTWYAKSIASILNDEWTADSGVFDLDCWTTNLKYFRERAAEIPTQQYLVVVDFHR